MHEVDVTSRKHEWKEKIYIQERKSHLHGNILDVNEHEMITNGFFFFLLNVDTPLVKSRYNHFSWTKKKFSKTYWFKLASAGQHSTKIEGSHKSFKHDEQIINKLKTMRSTVSSSTLVKWSLRVSKSRMRKKSDWLGKTETSERD